MGLFLASGCAARDLITPAPPFLDVLASSVAANPRNVLSAVVTARVRFADSVAVRYGQGGTLDSMTPAVRPTGDSAVVPVLGLLPQTPYVFQVVAYGPGPGVLGEPLPLTTDPLPTDVPRYVAGGADPAPGYVVFAAPGTPYGLVIDNTGRVVWYYRFVSGPGLNFQALANGHFAARPPTPANGPWIEIDPLGNVARTFSCARGLVPRFHDVIAEPSGGYWVMCDETRTMDLSAVGGVANAQVTGTVVQHISAGGDPLFEWNSFDHFEITDLDAASRTGSTVNWTHGNALALDSEGNLLVSFRSLSEVTNIDTRTGAVLWRMGGLRNQFTFQGAPTPGFSRQHGLRVTGPGGLVLLDNLGDPTASRAERYSYNASTRTARLEASYSSNPAVIALLGGTTQNLPGDHTLVAYGNGNRVQEYDDSGGVVWQIEGNTGYIFRAQRIWSLYRPGVGSPR